MIDLTREELEDILDAFRWIENAMEWSRPHGWIDALHIKNYKHLDQPTKCTQCGSNLVKEDEC